MLVLHITNGFDIIFVAIHSSRYSHGTYFKIQSMYKFDLIHDTKKGSLQISYGMKCVISSILDVFEICMMQQKDTRTRN